MWRVLLAFVAHRAVLLAVAFLAINARIESVAQSPGLPRLHDLSTLWVDFVSRLADLPESSALAKLMGEPFGRISLSTWEPFLWINRWWMGFTQMSSAASLLLWSNFFTLLFLRQIYFVFQKMVSKEVAIGATVLAILWPTSYELSLGSSLSLTCFLVALTVRFALEDQWLITGVGLGFLALIEPMAIGLVPFLGYIFWYFQRHSSVLEIAKRAAFFLLPFCITMIWRTGFYLERGVFVNGTALADMVKGVSGSGVGWMLSRDFAGQTASLLFFVAGACGAFFSNIALVHRILPIVLLVLAVACTPYASLASRLMLAAPCFEGIASASTPGVGNLLKAMMLALATYETYVVFR